MTSAQNGTEFPLQKFNSSMLLTNLFFSLCVPSSINHIEKANSQESRLFSKYIKDQCWNKFPTVPGRDPKRWRVDAVGNVVNYSLRGCDGCLCHEYDHIIPFSKGGKSVLENCQILQQRVNRYKGNDDDDPAKLSTYSCQKRFTKTELDSVEMALYGDIRDDNGKIKCRCKSFMEFKDAAAKGNGARPPKDSKKYPNCT